jgi:hypothetical protein
MASQLSQFVEPSQPVSAREVFLAWERLRLLYNVALAGLVVVLCTAVFDWSAFKVEDILVFAFLANVCFCVGPWVEGWMAMAGFDRAGSRGFVFGVGLVVAAALTYLAIISMTMKNWVGFLDT